MTPHCSVSKNLILSGSVFCEFLRQMALDLVSIYRYRCTDICNAVWSFATYSCPGIRVKMTGISAPGVREIALSSSTGVLGQFIQPIQLIGFRYRYILQSLMHMQLFKSMGLHLWTWYRSAFHVCPDVHLADTF